MAQAWSPAWMRRVLGLPELETFEYPPDCRSCMAECYIDMIAGPTQTGYRYVYKVGKRFQAKPYVRPGVQRSLASCQSAEEAAAEIVLLRCLWHAAAATKPGEGQAQDLQASGSG